MRQRARPVPVGAVAIVAALAISMALAAVPAAGAAQHRSAKASSASAAKGKLLRRSDLPKGWKAAASALTSSSSGTTSSTSQIRQIAACEGVSVSKLGHHPGTAQISFSRAQAVQFVFESVVVFSSTSGAAEAYRIFASPKAPGCVGPMLAKAIASGATSKGITASSITTARLAFPKEGSATTALRLGIPVTSTGQKIQTRADFIVIRSGKSVALLVPVSITKGFPTALAHSLGKKAAARLK